MGWRGIARGARKQSKQEKTACGNGFLTDVGLLAMRLVVGGLMAGHGAQKLFGAFKGPGLQGSAGWLESLGLKPGDRWAVLAGGSEFAGGALTAAGLLSPIGPVTMMAPMSMATGTVHAGKPIWVTAGGAELPAVNMAVATGLLLSGPGRFSLDHIFGMRTPKPVTLLVMLATGAGVYVGLKSRQAPPPQPEHSATDLPTEQSASEQQGQQEQPAAEHVGDNGHRQVEVTGANAGGR
jgi:putative oxidoreductase